MTLNKIEFFKGTKFNEAVQNAITKDLNSIFQYYPNLSPLHEFRNQTLYVGLKGSIPVYSRGCQIPFPIELFLPDNFPYASPMIRVTSKVTTTNKFINQTGFINISNIVTWNPSKISLYQLLGYLTNYISQIPDLSLTSDYGQAQPRSDPRTTEFEEAGMRQTQELLNELNQSLTQCFEGQTKQTLKSDLLKHVQYLETSLQKSIDQLKKEIEDGKAPPNFNPTPEMENIAKQKASDEVFQATMEILKDSFHNQQISVKDYIDLTKKLSSKHFEANIYPKLKSE